MLDVGHCYACAHAGNILIDARTDPTTGAVSAIPVLLDWGLAKTLPNHMRLAFSKFVYAASKMDFVLMLESFDDMQLKLNRTDMNEDMTNIRYLTRQLHVNTSSYYMCCMGLQSIVRCAACCTHGQMQCMVYMISVLSCALCSSCCYIAYLHANYQHLLQCCY
jgi:hypothetical protein